MLLKPLNDFIILEPEGTDIIDPEIKRIHESGILEIPEIAKDRLTKITPSGKIVSWGNKCKYIYKIGDKVYFSQFSGTKLLYEDKEYRVLIEGDLIAKEEA